MEKLHRSIMVSEVIENINLNDGGVFADLTFGEGGHTEEFLRKGASKVVATDRDGEAILRYKAEGDFAQDPRLELVHTRFSVFPIQFRQERFDGILMDLGVSTRQLLEGKRGFSFSHPGPLDMRMDSTDGQTLSDYLANISVDELADALYRNAEIPQARGIARRILERFRSGTLMSTEDLATVMGPKRGKTHPATAVFMALRMAVNEELTEIEKTIPALIDLLKPAGRLVVITFHSVEDRMVKKLFQKLAGRCICEQKICQCPRVERVKILTKKPLEPSANELARNPRARSARLRCVEKLAVSS